MNAIAQHDAATTFRQRLKAYFFPKIEKRWKPHVFMNILSAVVIAWVLFFSYLNANWHLAIDPQVVKCLPYDYFVVAQNKPEDIVSGRFYRYTAVGLAPVMKDGTPLVKIAAAVAGDKVDVNEKGIFINGKKWGDVNSYVMNKTSRSLASVTRSYVVAPGEVLLLGTLPRSYDGRYFGPVAIKQVTGRAFPLW